MIRLESKAKSESTPKNKSLLLTGFAIDGTRFVVVSYRFGENQGWNESGTAFCSAAWTPTEGNEQLRLTPTEGIVQGTEGIVQGTEGNEQMPIDNLVLNTICTTTEEEIIMVLETKVVGTVTYKRLSEWFDNDGAWVPSAHVVCSDSETGHGWGGQMTKQRWDSK